MAWISVGRIARAHGIRGELAVRCADPTSSALCRVEQLQIDGEPRLRKVLGARPVSSEVLIRLEGVVDRTQAEALRGKDVLVPRESFAPTEPGEYYFADLVGLLAVDELGGALGSVVGVWETGPVPVLVIGEGESELLVPFAEQFVLSVDLKAQKLVIDKPEYAE